MPQRRSEGMDGFCGTLVPQMGCAKHNKGVTVLVPSRLFLGLPKLGLGVMKEMSEPTMGALEAEFGISQDRYLTSL